MEQFYWTGQYSYPYFIWKTENDCLSIHGSKGGPCISLFIQIHRIGQSVFLNAMGKMKSLFIKELPIKTHGEKSITLTIQIARGEYHRIMIYVLTVAY